MKDNFIPTTFDSEFEFKKDSHGKSVSYLRRYLTNIKEEAEIVSIFSRKSCCNCGNPECTVERMEEVNVVQEFCVDYEEKATVHKMQLYPVRHLHKLKQ